jgi:hypothetical protein
MKRTEGQIAADKHRLTPIENKEAKCVLSVLIGVYRRLNWLFQQSGGSEMSRRQMIPATGSAESRAFRTACWSPGCCGHLKQSGGNDKGLEGPARRRKINLR